MLDIIERDLFKEIKSYLIDPEIIVIHGARQVGKTTLAQYVINDISSSVASTSILWVDLEDPAWLDICNKGIDELLRYARAKGYDTEHLLYICVDEIQYLDNPSSFLKLAYDRYKGRVKLIVTGSSTFSIKSKFKDTLVGRIIDFELFPLNFREFLRFKRLHYDLSVSDIPPSIHAELATLYKEFILKGGYPAIVLEDIEHKQEKKLKQIITTYIKTDIRDIGRIRNIEKFNHLVEILAAQTGNLVNISELSGTIGLAKQTVEEYLFILEHTYVIKLLHPYFNNIRSELTKMPKVFFEDSGVANIIENRSFSNKITGSLFENSVFSELRKQFETECLHFWRTNKNQEVDFVIDKIKVIPMEVKLLFREKDLTSLKYFVEKYGVKKAYICTLEKPAKSPFKWLEFIYPWEIALKIDP